MRCSSFLSYVEWCGQGDMINWWKSVVQDQWVAVAIGMDCIRRCQSAQLEASQQKVPVSTPVKAIKIFWMP